MNRPCLRQLCPGDYRQPNYFAGPDGRGPFSAGRDFRIPDNQCTPAIGTRLRYTTGCLPEMHFTTSGILLKNFEQVSVVVFRGPTYRTSNIKVKEAVVSVSRKIKQNGRQQVEFLVNKLVVIRHDTRVVARLLHSSTNYYRKN